MQQKWQQFSRSYQWSMSVFILEYLGWQKLVILKRWPDIKEFVEKQYVPVNTVKHLDNVLEQVALLNSKSCIQKLPGYETNISGKFCIISSLPLDQCVYISQLSFHDSMDLLLQPMDLRTLFSELGLGLRISVGKFTPLAVTAPMDGWQVPHL